MKEKILQLLDYLGIDYQLTEHNPIMTKFKCTTRLIMMKLSVFLHIS